jgi:(2Fe-2S) ferredoxin
MQEYKKHVFVCENVRDDGRKCCAASSSREMCEHLKQLASSSRELPRGSVRINRSGCLGQCAQGPALVIYPEGTWYTYSTRGDIDEIFERAIIRSERVGRLLLK